MSQLSNTNRTLYDIEFLNNKTGWVVGVEGTVRKTTNGGINWLEVTLPVEPRLLSSIHLIDSNYAYIVGYFETIIKTTDGGNSWTVIRYGTIGEGDSYDGVFFINKDTGWICGTGNKVLRTTNGGISIDSSHLSWPYLQDIYFKDANTGVLVAELGGTFKTTNAGLSWFRTEISLPTNQPWFFKLSFISNDTGWIAGGDGRVFRTTNCGTSWDSIYHLQTSPIAMYGVEFVNNSTGWVCGEEGRIYRTTNSGQSWTQQQSHTTNLITSMWFYNDSLGWASCGFGGILNTSNGGLTYVNSQELAAKKFKLHQNYPNPFNSSTNIEFEISINNIYSLVIYNSLGQIIEEVFNKKLESGRYQVLYNAGDLSSGIYIYRIFSNKLSLSKKFILIK